MKYLLQSPRSCGLDALHAALDSAGFKRSRDEIQALMGWRETGDIRSDLLDNPAIHAEVLNKLGVPWRWVDANMILQGKCAVGKTVVLLHGKDDPKTLPPEDWLSQHWAILAWWETTKPDVGGYVQFEWGDGTTRQFSHEQFKAAYSRGGPTNSAYEIGVSGKTRIDKIYSFFGKIIRKIFGR